MKNLKIKIIPQLKDNYSFIIFDIKSSFAIIIDPAEFLDHINFLKKNNLVLHSIFVTHHHKDHTAGVLKLGEHYPKAFVYSPDKSIKGTTHILKSGSKIKTPLNEFEIINTPGHTLDHIILYDEQNSILFCGDVLFRLGCGRVFEGTLEQMHKSLQKIYILPDETMVYCGHEYTIANLNFLKSIFENLNPLKEEEEKIKFEIETNLRSIPFKLGNEKLFNPFLNQESIYFADFKKKHNLTDFEMFKLVREKKDQF